MIVIVRHGNTFETGEPARRIGADTDLPLTRRGEQQAEALGRCFADKGWNFARILASPLQRTWQTAEAIAACQSTHARIEQASFLREIDHGPDEDKPEEQVVARIGQDVIDAWDREAIPPPGWHVDADARMAAWREFLATSARDTAPVLAVTSNGAARFALLSDPALSGQLRELNSLKLSTGAFGVIAPDSNGAWRIAAWNERP